MSYVELIVVLSIFSLLSAVAMFNFKGFQSKVDIQNLSNDIASTIIEAQRSALAGKWNAGAVLTWKPSYGVFFDITANNKNFLSLVDLNNDNVCTGAGCVSPYSVSGEVSNIINITKGNYVSSMSVTGQGVCANITSMSIVFTRPDSSATIKTNQAGCTNISYAEINVSSISSVTAKIKIYPSGRVQVN